MISQHDAQRLADLSYLIHTQILTEYGNQLNDPRKLALKAVHQQLAAMVNGDNTDQHGRWALSAPIGFGKSSGMAAFISAAWQLNLLGHGVTLTYTAARLNQLYAFEHELLHAGLPKAELRKFVSVVHASPIQNDPTLRPSDTDLTVPVLLVAHNKIRSIYRRDEDYKDRQTDLVYWLKCRGEQRDILIWDERCDITESAAIKLDKLVKAYGSLSTTADYATTTHKDFLTWFKEVLDKLTRAAQQLKDGQTEVIVDALMTPRLQEFYTLILKKSREAYREVKHDISEFLTMIRFKVRVLPEGVVSYRVVVPDCVSNCLVLDASYGISELSQIDQTIKSVEDHHPLLSQLHTQYGKRLADLRDCSNLHFTHWNRKAGKDAVESDCRSFLDGTCSENNIISEAFKFVSQYRTEGRPVLIWTHQQTEDLVKQCLTKAKLSGVTVDHYGRHDGVNHYKHCSAVVHLGIQQRDTLELKGAICGAYRSKTAKLEVHQVSAVQMTEKAVVFQQSNGRGSSRDTEFGKAKDQVTFAVWKDTGTQDLTYFLKKVYPGSTWINHQPAWIKTTGKIDTWAETVLTYLSGLPPEIKKISSRSLKRELKADTLSPSTWKLIMKKVSTLYSSYREQCPFPEWRMVGSSLVRIDAEHFGFKDESGRCDGLKVA